MKPCAFSVIFAALAVVGCAPKEDPRADAPEKYWAAVGLAEDRSLNELEAGEVVALCQGIHRLYLGGAGENGECTLKALAKLEDSNQTVSSPTYDANQTMTSGGRTEHADVAAGQANPALGCDQSAGVEGETVPLSPCEQAVERCVGAGGERTARLDGYCSVRDPLSARCTASVLEVKACLEAYSHELAFAWSDVSCENPESTRPTLPALEDLIECRELEASCAGFLHEMLAPVLPAKHSRSN